MYANGPIEMASFLLVAYWARTVSEGIHQGSPQVVEAYAGIGLTRPPPFERMGMPPPPSTEDIAALAYRYVVQRDVMISVASWGNRKQT